MNNLNEIENDWGLKPKLLKSANWLPTFQQWPERFLTRVSKTIASEWLRVLYKGRFVSYGELLESSAISLRDGTRRVSIASINDYLDRGATVVVRSADSYDSDFFNLTEALSNRFKCRVSCNFYAVRDEGRGYGPHFDTHHVFAVQLYGTKLWRVGNRPEKIASKAVPAADQLGSLGDASEITTFLAHPGDVLYIPKGVRHEAAPGPGGSSHASLGIHIPTGAELCEAIFRTRTVLQGASSDLLDFHGEISSTSLAAAQTALGIQDASTLMSEVTIEQNRSLVAESPSVNHP